MNVTETTTVAIIEEIERFGFANVSISADSFDYMDTYDGDSWGYADCTIYNVDGEVITGRLIGYDDFSMNINDVTSIELNF